MDQTGFCIGVGLAAAVLDEESRLERTLTARGLDLWVSPAGQPQDGDPHPDRSLFAVVPFITAMSKHWQHWDEGAFRNPEVWVGNRAVLSPLA